MTARALLVDRVRKLKIALLIVALLLGLLGWAAWNLNSYLDRNKDEIAGRIAAQLGRPIRFDSVGVSLRGGLAVAIDGLEIADSPEYSSGNLFSASTLRVVVRLVPALLGRIEVHKIVVDRPMLTVVRTAAGMNTDLLMHQSERSTVAPRDTGRGAETSKPSARAPESGKAGIAGPPPLDLLEIQEGRLHFIDRFRSPPVELFIDHLGATARSTGSHGTLAFDLHAALLSETPNIVAGGKLAIGPNGDLRATIDVQITAAELERTLGLLQSIGLAPAALTAAGPASLTAAFQTTSDGWHAGVRAGADDAVLAWGAAFAKPAGRPFAIDVEATGSDTGVQLSNGLVQVGNVTVGWSGMIEHAPPARELRVRIDDVQLAEVARVVPAISRLRPQGQVSAKVRATWEKTASVRLAGTIGLENVFLTPPSGPTVSGISTSIELDGRRLVLPPTRVMIGDAPITVFASTENFSARAFDFRVTADAFDSSDISGDDASGKLVLEDASLTGIAGFPADAPARMRARLAAASGKVAGVPLGEASAMLRLEGRRLIVNPLSAGLLGGSVTAEGIYDWSGDGNPSFNLRANGKSIELAEFARAFGATPRLEGSLDTEVTLAGTTGPWQQVRNTLVGGGTLTIRNGTLHGINLATGVLHGIAALPGLSLLLSAPVLDQYPQLLDHGKTRFKELRSRFTVAEGAILSDDITIGADDFTVSGRGEVGLDGWVDIRAMFEASVPLTSDLIDAVAPLRMLAAGTQRVSVPFRLRGRPPDLSVKPDTAFVGRRVGRGLIDLVTGGFLRRRDDKGTATAPGGKNTHENRSSTASSNASRRSLRQPPATKDSRVPGATGPQIPPATETETKTDGMAPGSSDAVDPGAPENGGSQDSTKPAPDRSVAEQILRGLGSLIGR